MIWLVVPALAAAAYHLLAIVAAFRWGRRPRLAGEAGRPAPLSILKPVHGRDPHFYEAIRSHASQDYPEFEILFGVRDSSDPALKDIARLKQEFPALPIETAIVATAAANAKAGVLAELARRARHPVLLVDDSDIVVEPGYLRAVAAPLADPANGLVTCLYRATGDSRAARFEALGIATEFAAGVLVARLLGQGEFALGATMAFRAETLREIGGFEAISGFLADDYQLGRRIHELGRRIVFAPAVVETSLGRASWRDVWRRQVRWSRTIRISRPGGYYGYAVTHATVWALAAFAAGQWWAGAAALIARMTAAAMAAIVLKDRYAPASLWLVPLRDLFGFAVWTAGAFGHTVWWRGQEFILSPDGSIRHADRNA